jgi:hypothetical protein
MIPRLHGVVVSGAVAFSLGASIAIAQVPPPLRGTIESVASPALVVKARDGTTTNVRLADDVRVFTLRQAALADAKPGSRVALTARQQMGGDGNLGAVEVYIFPDQPVRKTDAAVNESITGRENEVLTYIEGSVSSSANQALVIKNPDGERTIMVPANVRVVALVPATAADIKPGQFFLVPNATPTSLGTLASTIIVGTDRIDFAM